jgi:hypothetical protein
MLVPTGVEEALFKRVADGWIFSAPNPWTFARRRTFLVNDEQKKTDLAVQVRRGRYFRLLALIPMFALPAATFILVPSLLRPPSIVTWLLLALFVLLGTVTMNLCDYLPVRALLVGLPRTTERIGIVEMHVRQAQAMSVKALATIALIEVLACALILAQWLISVRGNALTLVSAAAFGLLGMLFLGMLFARLRMQRTTAQTGA